MRTSGDSRNDRLVVVFAGASEWEVTTLARAAPGTKNEKNQGSVTSEYVIVCDDHSRSGAWEEGTRLPPPGQAMRAGCYTTFIHPGWMRCIDGKGGIDGASSTALFSALGRGGQGPRYPYGMCQANLETGSRVVDRWRWWCCSLTVGARVSHLSV